MTIKVQINSYYNKYGTVQELRSTFSHIKSNIVLRVCMWTCEFVFGLVSSYLDGCDKQKEKKKKKKKTNMMTCRVAAQLKILTELCTYPPQLGYLCRLRLLLSFGIINRFLIQSIPE